MEIELASGETVIVDDDDYEWLSNWRWYRLRGARCSTLYAFNPEQGLMHRAIMNPPSDMQIDHIDGDGLNNRRDNLRIVDQTQNNANRKILRRNKTSKFKGVHIDKRSRNLRYRAVLYIYKKRINIGYFDDEKEAAIAYNNAAKRYFGEYASLNSIEG